jgi:ADP-ribose pyrophosphatase YjhB (NUDIX family)
MEGNDQMPGLAVIVAVIDDGKVLLTKREDFEVWCLPGGGVEDGESMAEAALRETREEAGIEVELTRLVGVYSRVGGMWNDVHAVLFAAKPVGGALKIQPGETIEVRYFPFEEIPDELLFGHRRRILDAIHEISGIAVRQELNLPVEGKPTRKELYALRDQSGLSRQQFYLDRIAQAEINEVVEVGRE